jgi:sulfur-oxidizing protein SoxY
MSSDQRADASEDDPSVALQTMEWGRAGAPSWRKRVEHGKLNGVCRRSGGNADRVRQGDHMIRKLSRRQALAFGAGAVSTAVLGVSSALAANDAEEAIKKFTGGKPPADGRVTLDLPEIAENGNTVPMTVMVESPMTEQSHVTDVLVVADGNPRSGVATFHFTPASGVAEANVRIRLASTQNVTAVARMNDGSFFKASKQVKVTIGGCGG